MRPISLSIAGLNSFIETQTIDFRKLCTGSVFGIFGDTGSGKSTVIDAMTLALYGQVERAPSKTQGIINHSVDAASVAFEFALRTPHGEKVYRCERKYTVKDGAITCRLARFSELEGCDWRVIADNVRQVDAAVVSTLGLTADDFTRAVVLPQGKFAEFLSLKGSDRRDMLERILNLGSFGQALVDRVKLRHDAVGTALDKIVAEQAGLGAAAKADLDYVRAAALNAEQRFEDAKQELLCREGEYQQAKEIVGLSAALARAKGLRAELEAEGERIGHLRREADLLEAAMRVEPRLHDYNTAQAALLEAELRLKDCVQSLSALRDEESATGEALDNAKAQRRGEEPALITRQTELKQAIGIEQKLAEQQKLLLEKEQALTELAAQLSRAEAEQALVSATERKASTRQRELQQELVTLTVSAQERSLLERAAAEERELASLRSQLADLRLGLTERQSAQKTALEQQTQAEERVAMLTPEVEAQAQELEALTAACPAEASVAEREQSDNCRVKLVELRGVYSEQEKLAGQLAVLAAHEARCRELLSSLDTRRQAEEEQAAQARTLAEQLAEAIESAWLSNAAVELAKSLVLDEPCPVCGSPDHPNPALSGDEGDGADLAAQHRSAREREQVLLRSLAALTTELGLKREEQQGVSREITALEGEKARLELCIAALRQYFPVEWKELPQDELTHAVETLAAALTNRTNQRSEKLRAIETLRADADSKREQLALAKQELAIITHALASIEREIVKESGQVSNLACEEGNVLWRLAEAVAALSATDLASARAAIDERERRRSELMAEAGNLAAEATRARERLQELADIVQQGRTALTAGRTDAVNRGELIQEMAEELRRLAGDVSPSVALIQAEASLNMLRGEEARLQELFSAVSSKRDEAARAHARAEEAYNQSAARLQATEQLLQDELTTAGVETPQKVAEILVRKLDLAIWREQIAGYDQQVLLAGAEVLRLLQELGGRFITEEQYASCEKAYFGAQEAHKNAIGDAGQWQAKLTDTAKRHGRFVELKTEQTELSRQRALLAELVSLLRGNALVDFLAAEHLYVIAGMATERLRVLTANRYALEVAQDGGFLMRDDANGGIKRPVHTLSGGETFITSLALALALSAEIQLRGKYPLEFFFLDEGFGTLDPVLLETVMTSLERMQGHKLSIGVISHVPELKERIAKKVLVTPAVPSGRGTRLKVEAY
jgi:exonuclease SbcC